MKLRTLFACLLLAVISVASADDEVEEATATPSSGPIFSSFSSFPVSEFPSDIATGSPTGSPTEPAPSSVPFSSSFSSFPVSEFPSQIATGSPTGSPTGPPTGPPTTKAPSFLPSTLTLEPSPAPVAEDCTGQPCDKFDPNACSCRLGLECRARSIGVHLCSQVSRAERTRLADTENVGGAAGRDSRGRNRATNSNPRQP